MSSGFELIGVMEGQTNGDSRQGTWKEKMGTQVP